ncbi:ras-related protein Rab-34-like isoform X1 [Acipenser oxyrinchus oxyrinchus]|uniref:Ras-related protein Rab-34-like isoform X1 n=1 Tax=Acipenser oxyrinchus oxyrinchus TaxID=40147 RepID=A0AAD8CTH2_ACIOX|nr:ras-related protein Rab-34-like isoform X1 [Acipenser oxyrinchus oxyrinchus]
MSVLPPVRRDRVIPQLPQCFTKEAALHTKDSFHSKVKGACQEQRTGTVGRFKISKVIVVGDLAVGKTCLINRFCKDAFDKNYKATIGVDFEMERFEVMGIPFSLQLWDTAGQERFKCIASTYYRGAQSKGPTAFIGWFYSAGAFLVGSVKRSSLCFLFAAIIIVFDVNDVVSLGHAKQWLEDAVKENDPSSVLLFLVGTKKDLSSPAQYSRIEEDAIQLAKEIKAEYWAVSSLTGENVNSFFFRVASLAFEASVLSELEKTNSRKIGEVIRINSNSDNLYVTSKKKKPNCCQ